jgi:hypothetical protein
MPSSNFRNKQKKFAPPDGRHGQSNRASAENFFNSPAHRSATETPCRFTKKSGRQDYPGFAGLCKFGCATRFALRAGSRTKVLILSQ